jgi:hypothetical protein
LLHIFPLQDRVEVAVLQALKKKPLATFDDILQEIFINLKNALTPNPTSVRTVLEEYADKTDGKWRLRDVVKVHEKAHDKMLVTLAKLGKLLGFKVWLGAQEQKGTFESKSMAEYSDFNKQIDMLWIKDGKIKWAFEVEYTTAVTEAFNRCSNIPESHGTRRVIVIPKEREKLLYKKLNSELLKDRAEKEGWRCIFFGDIEELLNKLDKREPLDITTVESILKTPVEIRARQDTMDNYLLTI